MVNFPLPSTAWLCTALAVVFAEPHVCGFSLPMQAISRIARARSRDVSSLPLCIASRYDDDRHNEHQQPQRAQVSSQQLPTLVNASVTRAQLLRSTVPSLAIVAAWVFGYRATPSFAALPTAEDYAFGTGSKVKQGRSEDMVKTPLSTSSVDPSNLVEVMGALSDELDSMETLVKKERWGDALARLRTFPLTTLKSPTLGLGSVKEVARVLGVTNTRASDILEASMEAGLTLREVEDVVFSNTRTLEFFNSADRKQIQDLADKATPPDLTEPLELLSDTKGLVDGVKKMMVATP